MLHYSWKMLNKNVKLKPTYKFMQYMMQPLGDWGAGRCLGKPLKGWLHWGRPLAGWLLWVGPWRAGFTAGWSLEGWLCWAGPWRAGCTAGWSLGAGCAGLVPVTPNMLKMCSFNSLRHGISVEKEFGYSFKVQVLAVIYLNTQLKVHVDLVHIIFPQHSSAIHFIDTSP